MAARLKTLDRDTPMLLPPDLRDWIRDDHIVHFLIDAVDRLPAEYFHTMPIRLTHPHTTCGS